MRRTLGAQLDLNKTDERQLFNYAADLKSKRNWASTFRDALRLIRDLRAGNLDVLFELFPWIENALLDAVEVGMESSSGTLGASSSLAIGELKSVIHEALEEYQLPSGLLQAPSQQTHNVIMETKQPAAPTPIEDNGIELEVTTGKTSPVVPLYNLSLKKAIVANGFPLDLPREIIVYGASVIEWKDGATLKQKQWIPHDKLTDQQRQWCIDAGVIQAKNGPKKLTGADVKFAIPEFEDINVELPQKNLSQ